MKYLIFLLLFVVTNLCNGQCTDRSEILQTFLDIPELDNVFYPEIEGRVPLYILNNEYIEKDIDLHKYGEKVIVVDDTTGTNGNFIKVAKWDKEQNNINIAFSYKIQNMEVHGTIERKDGECEVLDYEFIVF